MQLIEQVASDENIEQAFSWLCLKRKEHSPNNDVWNLRRHWQTVKPSLQQQLLDGTYQFSPQQEIRFETDTIELWASLDALVLKAVTLVLTQHLKPPISSKASMNADFRVVNLFFDPTGRPFGWPDDPCTKRPIEFLLFSFYNLNKTFSYS